MFCFLYQREISAAGVCLVVYLRVGVRVDLASGRCYEARNRIRNPLPILFFSFFTQELVRGCRTTFFFIVKTSVASVIMFPSRHIQELVRGR